MRGADVICGDEWERIVRLDGEGLSVAAIAGMVGRDPSAVLRVVRRARAAAAIRGYRYKSQEERAAAVALYVSGCGTAVVARRFGVSASTVIGWVAAAGAPRRPQRFLASELERARATQRAKRTPEAAS